jgi:hypothetical protein
MSLEETRLTCEVRSVREMNLYLAAGWKLVLTYVKHLSDSQEPRFVLGWQTDDQPVVPEMLDAWELSELDRQRYR